MIENPEFTKRDNRKETSPVLARKDLPARLAGPDRRSQVLRTAIAQFARTGFRGTTTLILARAAGVSERILYANFGSKERLFRKAVERNIRARLELLEVRTMPSESESAAVAVQRVAEATVTVCVVGARNSMLTTSALLENPEYAADLFRSGIGSVEIVWNREFTERFTDSRSRRILSIHLVPYAVRACLAYGFWLATLRHDAKSTAALANGFAAGIAQAASSLLSDHNAGMCRTIWLTK